MRSPNCFTSGDAAFSCANCPSSTSALPPSAAFLMNVRSDVVALLPALAPASVAFAAPDEPVCATAPSEQKPAIASPNPKLRNLLLETIVFPPVCHLDAVAAKGFGSKPPNRASDREGMYLPGQVIRTTSHW